PEVVPRAPMPASPAESFALSVNVPAFFAVRCTMPLPYWSVVTLDGDTVNAPESYPLSSLNPSMLMVEFGTGVIQSSYSARCTGTSTVWLIANGAEGKPKPMVALPTET